MESQHEGALQKLRQLEDSSKYQRREEEEVVITQAPRFSTQLNGPTDLVEGQSAHYECRIEPYPDPTMKVEWLHNGQALTTGHRFRTAYDFGFASLDVLTVYAEDSGEYTCRVTNRLGQAQSSVNTNVKCESRKNFPNLLLNSCFDCSQIVYYLRNSTRRCLAKDSVPRGRFPLQEGNSRRCYHVREAPVWSRLENNRASP